MGYAQTCTSVESNTMWHPKRGHHNVLSPHSNLELDDQGIDFSGVNEIPKLNDQGVWLCN